MEYSAFEVRILDMWCVSRINDFFQDLTSAGIVEVDLLVGREQSGEVLAHCLDVESPRHDRIEGRLGTEVAEDFLQISTIYSPKIPSRFEMYSNGQK